MESRNQPRHGRKRPPGVTRLISLGVFGILSAAAGAAQEEPLGLRLCDGPTCDLAPLLETHVDVTVTGIVARTRVTQRFHNPGDTWLEGVYLFPLPEDAAVDHLTVYVGPRVIEGRIEERAQARRIYDKARSTGAKASLIVQERANVFRTSLANIGPNEIVEIDIELQHLVRYDSGEMRLRFPTVVATRFSPDEPGREAQDAIDDLAGAIPRAMAPIHPLTIEVALDAGLPLRNLYSPSHLIEADDLGDVHLVNVRGDSFADRDFVLVWTPEPGISPQSATFYEQIGDETFALLMLLPPTLPQPDARRVSREAVFVIDSSGSMGGVSIQYARTALLLALDQLEPGDWFDVIDFDNEARSLFGHSVPADAESIDSARDFVEGLQADGGTNIAAALGLALDSEGKLADVRQVVFITDGAVGNEAQIFSQVARDLGDSRLFTVGIGTAPNAHLMRKAAHFGRGSYTFIGAAAEISNRMASLFDKLESATLTDIEVDWPGLAASEVSTRRIPDLYAGEPLVLTARLHQWPERVEVAGIERGRPWSIIRELAAPHHSSDDRGIARLWARREIDSLMDDLALGGDRDEIRTQVVDLAFQHHLVTKYTSLVAVDVSPSAPAGVAQQRLVPLNLPAGSLPRTATASPLHALIAIVLIVVGGLLASSQRRRPAHGLASESPS